MGERQFYFSVEVESGLTDDAETFAADVRRILARQGGWDQWGFSFVPVYPDASGARDIRTRLLHFFTIQLCSNATIARFGPDFDGMSVADCTHHFIRINVDRWRTGPKPTDATMALDDYRQYVVLHEVGHILSRCSHAHHQQSCAPDGRAPIMMQQTNGVGACTWNAWPVEGVDNLEVLDW